MVGTLSRDRHQSLLHGSTMERERPRLPRNVRPRVYRCIESHEGERVHPNIRFRELLVNTLRSGIYQLLLVDTVPDMRDQCCPAYFKRFKMQIGNMLKETGSRTDGDRYNVQPQLINQSSR